MGYTVYYIRRKTTEQVVYVGITCGKLSTRLSKHFKDKRSNPKKVNYFLKYKDDIEIVPIEQNIPSLEMANEKEVFHIAKQKIVNANLLNATIGGDGTKGFVSWNAGKKCDYIDKIIENHPRLKKVYAYDLDGNFVNEYRSIKIASQETGASRHSIKNCCMFLKRFKQSKGFMWRFEKLEKIEPIKYDDDLRIKKIAESKMINAKRVQMLNINTKDSVVFLSLKEASLQTGIKYHTILAAIKHERICNKKYIFTYA